MKSKHLILILVLGLCLIGSSVFAAYPEKAINYMVTFSPGGESDVTARMQQKYLEEALGQKVAIFYKTGGGGGVGWAELAKTKPDGYTISGVNEPHTILQPLQREDCGFTTEGLTRIGLFQFTPSALIVRKDSPFMTLQDVIDAAKENPGSITVGGSGMWASTHFTAVLLEKEADIDLTYIPFAGSGTSKPALLGGHVAVTVGHPTWVADMQDEVRVLAVAGEERVPFLSDVPTFKELGFDIVEGSYRGVAAPPGTPKEIVDKLAAVFEDVNENPEFAKKMESLGFQLLWKGPEEYTNWLKQRKEYYIQLLADLGYDQ